MHTELARDYGTADQPAPSLDRIGTSADRVERLGNVVKRFCDRFYNGGEPANTTVGGNTLSAVPVGHNGQIARLSDAIDFLESAAQTLDTIG